MKYIIEGTDEFSSSYLESGFRNGVCKFLPSDIYKDLSSAQLLPFIASPILSSMLFTCPNEIVANNNATNVILIFFIIIFYYNNVIHHYTIAIRSINYFADKTSSCEWIALLLLNWFCMNVTVIILGVSIVAIENKCNFCISSCPVYNNMRFFRKSLE